MFEYTGCKCPVCQQPFTNEAQIVVCPDCGAPHHRACYAAQGACTFAGRHSVDFAWKPAPDQAIHQTPLPLPQVTCPRCGEPNEKTDARCQNCGMPLQKGAAQYGPDSVQEIDPFSIPDLPAEWRLTPDEKLNGIAAKHWATYVGKNAIYYLFNFKRMQLQGQKIGACFSAFLFGPYYFLYRKMWGIGLPLLVASLSLFWTPFLLRLLLYLQSPLVAGVSADFVQLLSNTFFALHMVLNFLTGTFALYWYQKSATKRMQSLLANPEEPLRDTLLAKKGGVSLTALVLSIAASAFFVILLLYFFDFPFSALL